MKRHLKSSVVFVTAGTPQANRRVESAVPHNATIMLEPEPKPPPGLRRVSLILRVLGLGIALSGSCGVAGVIWQEAESGKKQSSIPLHHGGRLVLRLVFQRVPATLRG
jgi:hypothetical protein